MASLQVVKKSLVLAPPHRVWAALTDFDRRWSSTGGTSLVTIEIDPDARGSLLTLTESGFDGIHGDLLQRAIEASAVGWATQVLQLELFLSGAIDLRPVKG